MKYLASVYLLSFAFSNVRGKPVVRHESSPQVRAAVMSSGVITDIAEKDPETQRVDINHHFLLHQTSEKDPVEGILIAKNPFTTSQFLRLCNASSKLTCFTHLKVAVVRGKKIYLKVAMDETGMDENLTFKALKAYMPQFIEFLREHLALEDVGKTLASYSTEGIILPAESIAAEFRAAGKELKNRTLAKELMRNLTEAKAKELMRNLTEANEDEDEDGEPPEPEAKLYSHFLLHQTDASSPVEGVLFMKSGQDFKSLDVEKVCSTYKQELECIEDLPISIMRAPKETLTRFLAQNPTVEFMDLRTDAAHVVNFLKDHIGEESVPELLTIYAESGVTIPHEVTREFDIKSGLLDISNDDNVQDTSDESDD